MYASCVWWEHRWKKSRKRSNGPHWQTDRVEDYITLHSMMSQFNFFLVLRMKTRVLCILGRYSARGAMFPDHFMLSFHFLYVRAFYLNICIYAMYVPGAHREQKRALNALELEFPVVVSHCLGARNWTKPSVRGTSAFSCWAISPANFLYCLNRNPSTL